MIHVLDIFGDQTLIKILGTDFALLRTLDGVEKPVSFAAPAGHNGEKIDFEGLRILPGHEDIFARRLAQTDHNLVAFQPSDGDSGPTVGIAGRSLNFHLILSAAAFPDGRYGVSLASDHDFVHFRILPIDLAINPSWPAEQTNMSIIGGPKHDGSVPAKPILCLNELLLPFLAKRVIILIIGCPQECLAWSRKQIV